MDYPASFIGCTAELEFMGLNPITWNQYGMPIQSGSKCQCAPNVIGAPMGYTDCLVGHSTYDISSMTFLCWPGL